MTTPQTLDPDRLEGLTVVDNDGDKVGKVTTVFIDTTSERPEWVSVKTGFFGSNETLVPLRSANLGDDEIRVPYTKEHIKSAPHHNPEEALSDADESALYSYYEISGGSSSADYSQGSGTATTGTAGAAGFAGSESRTTDREFTDRESTDRESTGRESTGRGTVGRDTSGPTTDDAMTRSEERLNVGTERVEAGRARLRKYIVTEQVTQTVPVSHEEIRVEREPITDANAGAALDGPELSEEEHEVVLHAERPVVDKETVPVERVRLGTETVTGEESVSDEVRQERIETVTDGERGDRGVR